MLFSKKENFEYLCVFDVGSDSVVGSFVKRYFEDDRKPLVLYTKSKSFSSIGEYKKKGIHPQKVLLQIFTHIVSNIESFRKANNLQPPRRAHITLSSPWYASETHCEILSSKEPKEFTEEDFAQIVLKAGDNLRTKAQESTPVLKGYFRSGSHVVENHITSIKINGYAIDNPFGKKYKQMDIDFFVTIIPKDLNDDLIESLEMMWRSVRVTISSFALTHYAVAKRHSLLGENVMFVDVTGSATEITKIVDGSIVSSKYLYIGKIHFRKAISEATGSPAYIASSQFELFAKKELSSTEMANTQFALAPVETRWQNECVSYIEKEHENEYSCAEYVLSADYNFQNYLNSLFRTALEKTDFAAECKPDISTIETYNNLVVYIEPEMQHSFSSISVLYSSQIRLR